MKQTTYLPLILLVSMVTTGQILGSGNPETKEANPEQLLNAAKSAIKVGLNLDPSLTFPKMDAAAKSALRAKAIQESSDELNVPATDKQLEAILKTPAGVKSLLEIMQKNADASLEIATALSVKAAAPATFEETVNSLLGHIGKQDANLGFERPESPTRAHKITAVEAAVKAAQTVHTDTANHTNPGFFGKAADYIAPRGTQVSKVNLETTTKSALDAYKVAVTPKPAVATSSNPANPTQDDSKRAKSPAKPTGTKN